MFGWCFNIKYITGSWDKTILLEDTQVCEVFFIDIGTVKYKMRYNTLKKVYFSPITEKSNRYSFLLMLFICPEIVTIPTQPN